ncbi:MAG: glycosyltransferase [Bacteroidota bacterium]|nr:glycosyltransferase [Bacteroidota bacterium]
MYADPEQIFIPFEIKNLQLRDFPYHLPKDYFKGPVYWNFWNGDVPLGSLMIQKSVFNGENFFMSDMKRVIAAAVHHYQVKNKAEEYSWAVDFERKDFDSFREYILKVTAWSEPLPLERELPLSVIICTAGRPSDLSNCLESLASMHYVPKEIVVVDNAPGNPKMKEITGLYHHVKLIEEPRRGLDIARNTGLRCASQEIITYVDDDVKVHPMWLYHVWKTYEDEKVMAGTGLVLPAEIKHFSQYLFECFWTFNRGYIDRFYTPDFLEENLSAGPPVWKIGAGANMSFRRSFLLRCGGFDERLDAGAAGCNGDSECWFRILKNGGKIHYNPRAVNWHYHRADKTAYFNQIYSYMKGFTAAALIQQRQLSDAGYKKHLFVTLPKFYKQVLTERGEYYQLRKVTAWSEIKGIVAGTWYYMRHRKPKLLTA